MSAKRTWPVREPSDWKFDISFTGSDNEYCLRLIDEQGQTPPILDHLIFSRVTYESLIMFSERIARMGEMGVIHLSVDGEKVIVRYAGSSSVDFADWDGTIVRIDRSIFRQAMEVADLARTK